MIPDATDPRWKELLLGSSTHQFKTATAGMLWGRLRRSLDTDPSPANYAACLEQAIAFFQKYEKILQQDIAIIFSNGGK